MKKLTDADLLRMLELSGYDASLVHPHSYRTFSWKDFSDRIILHMSADPVDVQERVLRSAGTAT